MTESMQMYTYRGEPIKQAEHTPAWLGKLILRIDSVRDSSVIQMQVLNIDGVRWLELNGSGNLERLG